ncbi:AsmA family protein [Nitrincola sp. MINF-07-Sa-05]|uniref:AsmA family protein n=1 Tax=Nitrincola salilacus TaxID=3400273 RepID=UPI003917D5A4
MKRLLKLILGLFALAMTLLLAVAVYLTLFFNPNQYRPDIERIALEQGGIELQIDGDVSWSIFPWVGFDIREITTRYPGQADLASLRKAHVSLHLPALATGQMQIRDILIDGLELNLQRNEQGEVNWLPQGSKPQPSETTAAPASAEQKLLTLDIASILISNAELHYQDLLLGQTLTLTDLNITASNLLAEQRFPADLSFTLHGSGGPEALTATLNLQGDFLLSPEQMLLQAHNLTSQIALSGTELPAPLEMILKGNLEKDLRSGTTSLNNFKLSLANLQLQGRLVLDDSGLPPPESEAAETAMPNLTGEISIAPFDLKLFMETLGRPLPDTADPAALRLISLNAALNSQNKYLHLNPLVLRVDDTNLAGTLVYSRENQHLNIHLRGDVLDADRYRAASDVSDDDSAANSAENSAANTSEAAQPTYSQEPLTDLDLLRSLRLDAMLDLQRLIFAGLTLNDPGMTLQADNGLINLSRLNANLYDGSIRNSMTLDATGDTLQIDSQHAIQSVQLGPLLKDLQASTTNENSGAVSGQLNAEADLTTAGLSPHDLIRQLNGSISLTMSDGAVQGFDMANNLCREINQALTGEEAATQQASQSQQPQLPTVFSNLQASLRVRQGILINEDLNANLDALQLTGQGQIDLSAQALDYRFGLTAKDEGFEQNCPIASALQGREFPIVCAGSFDMPAAQLCRPDADQFTELLRGELEQRLSEKLQERLSEEAVRNLLQGLSPE